MRKVLFLALLAGCYDTSSAPSCRIQCATDADCTDGLTCGPGNLCTDGEDCLSPPSCTPDEFIACVDDMAHACNATGDGTTDTACEHGCNMTERRCNDCVPDAMSCTTDMMSVQQCSPDGRTQNVADACAAGCNPGDGSVAAHCTYLQPAWLPDICDMPAADDTFAPNASATISTALDTNCSSIVVQMANGNPIGPQICVIRAKTVTIANAITTTFTGNRAIALVADSQLTVAGTIDVGAINASNTPGPGLAGGNGGAPSSTGGGGGAGFGTAGGNGGSTSTGGGGAGGATTDPSTRAFFAGGYSAGSSGGIMPNPVTDIAGGAGGGGLLLIACRGNASVTGVINAGGGGGRGNHDTLGGAGIQNSKGPSGGGSGGYVVIQGLSVSVAGGVFANGGGGAGGSNTDDGSGPIGSKGLSSTSAAPGGAGVSSNGGNGGVLSQPGQNGTGAGAGASYGGGGGGGAGVIHIYAPMGVTPMTTGTMSPAFTRKNAQVR